MKRKRGVRDSQGESTGGNGRTDEDSQGSQGSQEGGTRKKRRVGARYAPLTPRLHDTVPRVRMRPHIEVADGQITALVFSRLQRTPSPLPGRMGDHTVAWQAIVDALRADLFGLDLAAAVEKLTARQEEAGAWMTEPQAGRLAMLYMLDDKLGRAHRLKRAKLLEDAAQRTADHLEAARRNLRNTASDEDVTAELRAAIAHHLAYLNYLPFATVPAESAGGSKSSGEGHARRCIVEFESSGRRRLHVTATDTTAQMETDDEPAPGEQGPSGAGNTTSGQSGDRDKGKDHLDEAEEDEPGEPLNTSVITAKGLRAALWGLFDFKAALRESGAQEALFPGGHTEITADYETLNTLFEKLKKVKRWEGENGGHSIKEDVDKISKETYREVSRVAGLIREGVDTALEAASTVAAVRRRNKRAAERHVEIGKALADVAALSTSVAEAENGAMPRAAVVLAHLLREHQRAVYTAYPSTVTESEFRGQDTTDTLIEHLNLMIGVHYSGFRPQDRTAMLSAVRLELAELDEPDVAEPNDWSTQAAGEMLVVTYDAAKGALTVHGRAPAPAGVGGMGSHVTAWVEEVDAIKRVVARASEPAQALEMVKDLVSADLRSDVMRLHPYLPTDQIEADQHIHLFDAACDAFEATDVRSAVTAYLCFRNLLPFATVDVGDRAGHGERSGASGKKNFDAEALRHAADLQQEMTDNEQRRAEAADALEAAAKALHPTPTAGVRWHVHQPLREAVLAATDELQKHAELLRRAGHRIETQPDTSSTDVDDLDEDEDEDEDEVERYEVPEVYKPIVTARTQEHYRVQTLA